MRFSGLSGPALGLVTGRLWVVPGWWGWRCSGRWGSGDGEFAVVDCAVVKWQISTRLVRSVGPRSSQGGCGGDAAVRGHGAAGIHAAGPVAYREGGALGFGGVPLREPDG